MKQRFLHEEVEEDLVLVEVIEFDEAVFLEGDLSVDQVDDLVEAFAGVVIIENFEEGHALRVLGVGGMDLVVRGLIFIGTPDWLVGTIPVGCFRGGGTHAGVIHFI